MAMNFTWKLIMNALRFKLENELDPKKMYEFEAQNECVHLHNICIPTTKPARR